MYISGYANICGADGQIHTSFTSAENAERKEYIVMTLLTTSTDGEPLEVCDCIYGDGACPEHGE